jgi:hypothetical protein
MLASGDRIASLLGRLLRRMERVAQALTGSHGNTS